MHGGSLKDLAFGGANLSSICADCVGDLGVRALKYRGWDGRGWKGTGGAIVLVGFW